MPEPPPQILVLLPFEPAGFAMLDRVIGPAAAALGLETMHLDPKAWHGSLQHSLEQAVRDCPLAVAYLPDRNPNVIFELGVVVAFRRPVVVMAENRGDIPDFLTDGACLTGPFLPEALARALARMLETTRKGELGCTS